jgi:hypothetical protein
MKMIEGWLTKWWRFWSIRLNALGLMILSWVQFDPVGALAAWNMMPHDVRDALPQSTLAIVGAALIGLSMLARVVHQPKLANK